MTPETVLDVFRHTAYVIMMISFVILLPGMVIGIIISMFQAATQINEMTLTFVPKFIVTLLALMVTGGWLMSTIINFATNLIREIPYLIG